MSPSARLDLKLRLYRKLARRGLFLPRFVNFFLTRGQRGDLWLPGRHRIGQYTHPDLRRLGACYLLAASAYPYGNELYEEPEVFSSTDAIHWRRKAHVPLRRAERKLWHLSDPDLLLKGEIAYLLYRKCLRRSKGGEDEILILPLARGYEARRILRAPKGGLLSPASIELRDGRLAIFCVDTTPEGEHRLRRYVSADPLAWGAFDFVAFPGRKLWHVDVSRIGERFLGLFVALREGAGDGTSLLLADSPDEGLSWREIEIVAIPGLSPRRIYRSSLCEADDHQILAVSFEAEDASWHIRSFAVLIGDEGIAFLE